MPSFRTALVALALAALGADRAAGAQAAEFAPHQRWRLLASSVAPWLPSGAAFCAGSELLWVGGQGGSPRAMLLATAPLLGSGAPGPLFEVPLPAASGPLAVAGGSDERALLSVSQAVLYGTVRRTQVARWDARGSATTPQWSLDLALAADGAPRVASSRDGGRVAVAVHDSTSQLVHVAWLAAGDGSSLGSLTASGGALRAFSASADAGRLALVLGNELRVVALGGALEHAEPLATSTLALALSGDGETLALGAGARVRVLSRAGGAWQDAAEVLAPTGEVAVRAALSDDGGVLALGWWNATTGRAVRLQVLEVATGAVRYERSLAGAPSGPQDFVEALALSPDGRRAAFGCWGTADAQPEVLWVDVASGSELAALDLPGSVRTLALDSSGTRLAIGSKATHASVFSGVGEVRLLDSGERALQLTSETRAGATMRVERHAPGASAVLFLVGAPLVQPVLAGGESLWIDRRSAQRQVRPVSAAGVATLDVALPAAAAGTTLAVQTVERVPGQASCLRPEVLLPVIF